MYRLSTALIATIAFLAGTSARADFIPWSYSWSADPQQVLDGAGAGVAVYTTSAGNISSSLDVPGGVALQAFAPDTNLGVHMLNDAPYQITMHITDQASGKMGDFTFSGKLSGDINTGSLTNVFNEPVTQAQTLGANVYSVTIGGFAPPGSPASNVWGEIGADVTVTAGAPVSEVPEPAGLALAGIALLMLSGWCWWERKRVRVLAPSMS